MKLSDELDAIEIPDQINHFSPLQKLSIYWALIAIVLKFVKLFTGRRADEKIDMILDWGNNELPFITEDRQ